MDVLKAERNGSLLTGKNLQYNLASYEWASANLQLHLLLYNNIPMKLSFNAEMLTEVEVTEVTEIYAQETRTAAGQLIKGQFSLGNNSTCLMSSEKNCF